MVDRCFLLDDCVVWEVFRPAVLAEHMCPVLLNGFNEFNCWYILLALHECIDYGWIYSSIPTEGSVLSFFYSVALLLWSSLHSRCLSLLMLLTVLQTAGKGCNINKGSPRPRGQGLSEVGVSKAANTPKAKKHCLSVQQAWNFRRRRRAQVCLITQVVHVCVSRNTKGKQEATESRDSRGSLLGVGQATVYCYSKISNRKGMKTKSQQITYFKISHKWT